MFYAIVRTGYIMTSYNVKLTERELSELILKENPSVVLYEEEFGEKAAALKNVSRKSHLFLQETKSRKEIWPVIRRS